jgi:hypothetical protein
MNKYAFLASTLNRIELVRFTQQQAYQ